MPETHTNPEKPNRNPPNLRKRSRLRILLWCVGGLLVLLIASLTAGAIWLRSAAKAALPQLDGTLHLAGLSAPVAVRRDAHGVPHIEAATQSDLFLAQGYLTAEERLWQMDTFRRNANGDLAQILGPALLAHDKLQRVLQIRIVAQRIYSHLPADEHARFDTYARGVNAYIAQAEASNSLPVEFKLLMYRPEPWTGTDSVSVGLMEVQELDMHAETKLTRALVAAKLNDLQLEADLYPVGSWRDHPPTGVDVDLTKPHPEPPPSGDDDDENTEARASPARTEQALRTLERPTVLKGHDFSRAESAAKKDGALASEANPADAASLRAAIDLLNAQPPCDGCVWGSNEWVIAGKHTASGKPLLSNDMHIRLTEPNIWYMADMKAPGFHAAGVTLPGVPYMVAGHNDHVAWGFTALMADVQDLYEEKLDGKGNYEGNDGQWHPLSVDREVIHVRGGEDEVVNVQSTEHGPLVSSVSGHDYKQPIALKWTIYDPTLNTIPLYAMDAASNWSEFSAALKDWAWPTQNLVYADDQGHVAYHAIGKVPIRWGGMGIFDTPVPHDTQNFRYEWGDFGHPEHFQTFIPFDAMPNAFDPPSGFLATANSRVTNYSVRHDPRRMT